MPELSVFFCDQPEHLRLPISQGYVYLVANRRQVFLADEAAAFTDANGKPVQGKLVVADLRLLWERFCIVRGDRSEFTFDEAQRITRLNRVLINRLVRAGAMPEIQETYDPQGVFAAVVASVLYRRGVAFSTCIKAAIFVFSGEGAACKPT